MRKNDSELLFSLLHKFLLEYLPVRKNMSDKTICSYKATLNNYRIYLKEQFDIGFADFSFDYFTREHIYNYLIYLRDIKGNCNNTLNVRLAALCSFLKYCAEESIELSKYFVDVAKIHSFKVYSRERLEFLSEEHLQLLFSVADTFKQKDRRNRFLVIFFYETGCRLREVLDLKVGNLRFTGKAAAVTVVGKGRKARTIPMTTAATKHLIAYLNEFHKERKPDAYLFYTIHDGSPTQMKEGTVDSILKNLAKKAHEIDSTFPLNLHAHVLRHTLAMNIYRRGMPISYIRDILGHSSIETTSIYAHADEKTMLKALEAVDSTLPEKHRTSVKEWKGKEEDLLRFCGLA